MQKSSTYSGLLPVQWREKRGFDWIISTLQANSLTKFCFFLLGYIKFEKKFDPKALDFSSKNSKKLNYEEFRGGFVMW